MQQQSSFKNITTKHLLPLAAALCVFASPSAASGNPEFIDFIVKKAHEGGLTSCDPAIRQAFSLVAGSDVRVTTTNIPGVPRANSLIIHTVFGYTGDVAQQEAIFRDMGGACSYSMTTTLARTQSCAATLADLPEFKYENEINGVVYTKNDGNVNMLLTPIGERGCIQTMRLTQQR